MSKNKCTNPKCIGTRGRRSGSADIPDHIVDIWNEDDWFSDITDRLHERWMEACDCQACAQRTYKTSVVMIYLLFRLGVTPTIRNKYE